MSGDSEHFVYEGGEVYAFQIMYIAWGIRCIFMIEGGR